MFLTRPVTNSREERDAKYDIRELLDFERYCRDNALWDEMRKCFAAESYVNISWFQGTGSEFVAASERMNTYAPHKIYNTLIWVNDDRAVAVMMATIQVRHSLDGATYEVNSDVRLVFSVVREGGQWYIARFESIYDKDEIRPVVPGQTLIVSSDELSKYRESYACLSYMAEKNGLKTNQELVGRDRPEMVAQMYQRLGDWLDKKSGGKKSGDD